MTAYSLQGTLRRAKVYLRSIYQNGVAAQAAYENAGAPSNGTNGTLAGIAGKGALLLDTTGGALYQNTNTLASPTYTLYVVP